MMRWVILIAILVNVVLFYWFGGQQAQRIAAQKNRDVFVGSGVDTIELIAEIPEDRLVYIEDSPLLPEQIPEEAVEVSDPVAAPGVCMVIGPVLFEAVAEQIAGELKAAGVAVSMWV